jgi:hypothetical protein
VTDRPTRAATPSAGTGEPRPGTPAPVAVPGLGPSSPPDRPGGADDPRQGSWCRNCDAKLVGPFCAGCGQRADEYTVSLRVLARDFADEYLSFDSRLFRTVLNLFFRPGYLTRQYLAGRRARYVRPLRLYIVASILFFLSFSLFGGGFRINVESPPGETREGAAAVAEEGTLDGGADGEAIARDAMAREILPAVHGLQYTVRILGMEFDAQERAQRLATIGIGGFADAFAQSAERYLPRMMFVLLPIFAFLLKILYVRRRWYYAEHFIFALHIHAFLFALFLMLLVLPSGRPPAGLMVLWGMLYLFLAMRHVYRQSWIKTGLKYMMLTGAYSVALGLTFVSLVVFTALFA